MKNLFRYVLAQMRGSSPERAEKAHIKAGRNFASLPGSAWLMALPGQGA